MPKPSDLSAQSATSSNDIIEAGLLDLSDLWQIVRHSWRLIACFVLLFTTIALFFALTTAKQWEATATIRIGHIPADASEYKLVENPLQTLERIKLIGFKQKVLISLNLPTVRGLDKRSDLISSSLKGTAIQSTDFINLSIHGYSQTDALHALQSAVNEIKTAHATISNPQKNNVTNELKLTNENLSSLATDVSNLKIQIDALGIYKAGSAFAPSIVATNLLIEKEKSKQLLQTQQIKYSARLAAFDEQATALVSPIYISQYPVSPNKKLFLLFGLLSGLLVGILIAILKYKNPTKENI